MMICSNQIGDSRGGLISLLCIRFSTYNLIWFELGMHYSKYLVVIQTQKGKLILYESERILCKLANFMQELLK